MGKNEGSELIQIRNADDLKALAEMASETHNHFLDTIRPLITKDRAEFVRKLRIEGYTWRAIARDCHLKFNGSWSPISNQLAGMALCEISAPFFGENWNDEIWN